MENASTFQIDWKKELNSDEREVCHTQAEVFESSQFEYNWDAFDFITKFMNSDLAADMDKNTPAYYTLEPEQLLATLPDALNPNPIIEKKSISALHWIGYLYRYWACMGTPSKDIIKLVPVREAYLDYVALHTLSVKEAIDVFCQTSKQPS